MSAKAETLLGDDELLIVRTFDAPVSLVFRLWEKREDMMRWMGPGISPARASTSTSARAVRGGPASSPKPPRSGWADSTTARSKGTDVSFSPSWRRTKAAGPASRHSSR